MKKNQYMAPELSVINLNIVDGIMLTVSAGGDTILGDGGNTTAGMEAASKRYNTTTVNWQDWGEE